ncbi:hypothetical protein ET338_21515, partial [Salmonella enterica]|nr:hypothetical protein [Salmonella enterica]
MNCIINSFYQRLSLSYFLLRFRNNGFIIISEKYIWKSIFTLHIMAGLNLGYLVVRFLLVR